MIITKNLVVLNLPKTGSSFARRVIKDIFLKRKNKNILTRVLCKFNLKSIGFQEIKTEHPTVHNFKDYHGCFDQIPHIDKNKTILSIVRDPYLRLESLYKFRWWVKNPPLEPEVIKTHFPTFPNLTFEQFLELQILVNGSLKKKYKIDEKLKIGNQSIQFIRFFFKNHENVLAELNTEYFVNGSYKQDLCDVNLIRNENLNEELVSFLSKNGFLKEEINFILNHEKVNVTESNIESSLISEELLSYVDENEWILFEILSYLGFDYKRIK
jgi:hypothetical protein